MASKRPAAPPPAKHLTATMRVLRAFHARPATTVADAHDAVKSLALRIGAGEPTKADLLLEEKLRKATGVTLAELAVLAEDWPV